MGWLVGSACGLTFYLAQFLWSPTVAVLLAIISGVLITGAFHEDGFADVCDGFGGSYDKSRILTIMKDSAIGVYGALGLGLLLALKINVLISFPTEKLPIIFIAAHSISRLFPLFLMCFYDYARLENSKSQIAIYIPTRHDLTIATFIALLPMSLLPTIYWLSIIPLGLITFCLGRFFYKHIGGYTGDCLGATQQICETLFYLTLSGLWTFI